MHTTDYFDTFIAAADDCPAKSGEEPPLRGEEKSVARIHYELLFGRPYRYTSDEAIFLTHALRKGIPEADYAAEKEALFAKGQPCMRSSPLVKRYGWGVHSDEKGRIAIYGRESAEYSAFLGNQKLKQLKGMKSARG